jgi:hypothetical protein
MGLKGIHPFYEDRETTIEKLSQASNKKGSLRGYRLPKEDGVSKLRLWRLT